MISDKELRHIEKAAIADYSGHMTYWKNNADSLAMGLQCFLECWNYYVNKDLRANNLFNPRWIQH